MSGRITDTPIPDPEHPKSTSLNVEQSGSASKSKQKIGEGVISGIAVVLLILAVDLYLALKYLG